MSKHFVAVLTLLRLVQGSSTSDSICPGSGGCRGSGWLDENDSLLDVGMQLLQHKSVARRLQDPQIGQGSTISASTVANVENMFNLKQQQHQQQDAFQPDLSFSESTAVQQFRYRKAQRIASATADLADRSLEHHEKQHQHRQQQLHQHQRQQHQQHKLQQHVQEEQESKNKRKLTQDWWNCSTKAWTFRCHLQEGPPPDRVLIILACGRQFVIFLVGAVFLELALSSAWFQSISKSESGIGSQNLTRKPDTCATAKRSSPLQESQRLKTKLNEQALTRQHVLGPCATEVPGFKSIHEWLPDNDSQAILAQDRHAPSYTYAKLKQIMLSQKADEAFSSAGVTSVKDRVAVSMPTGTDMAVCMLVVMTRCTACPLDPKFNEDEYDACLQMLGVVAIVTDHKSAAGIAAKKQGISIIHPDSILLGSEMDTAIPHPDPTYRPFLRTSSEDMVLVLSTSGTTGLPKLVPYTWQRLCAAGYCISTSLELSSHDICLNAMPLFHIGGISCNLFASLNAGGAVICLPDARMPTFLPCLASKPQPTWYYAVPAIHSAVCDSVEAGALSEMLSPHKLRFCRNAGAALPPSLAQRLSKCLQCSIVPTYGMSECMPIASVNLRWEELDIPTVGKITGPEVKIVGADEEQLPISDTTENGSSHYGDILVRGPLVMPKYLQTPGNQANHVDSNSDAFLGDWFRTGDRGFLDEDGQLYITGRSKDMINRGGETLSPIAIENTLDGLDVAQTVVAFPVPHSNLGETVGLAVVLKEGVETCPEKVFDFCEQRLSTVRRPDVVVFLTEERLPRTRTGKLQRIKIADHIKLECHEFPAAFEAGDSDDNPLKSLDVASVLAPTVDSLGMTRTKMSSKQDLAELGCIQSAIGLSLFCVIAHHISGNGYLSDKYGGVAIAWQKIRFGDTNMTRLLALLAYREVNSEGPALSGRDLVMLATLVSWYYLPILPAIFSAAVSLSTGMSQTFLYASMTNDRQNHSSWFFQCALYMKAFLMMFHYLPASVSVKAMIYVGLLLITPFFEATLGTELIYAPWHGFKLGWLLTYLPWYLAAFYYGEKFAAWCHKKELLSQPATVRVLSFLLYWITIQFGRITDEYLSSSAYPSLLYLLSSMTIYHFTVVLQGLTLIIALGDGISILMKLGQGAFTAYVSHKLFGYLFFISGITFWGLVSLPPLTVILDMAGSPEPSIPISIGLLMLITATYMLGFANPLQFFLIQVGSSVFRLCNRVYCRMAGP